MLHLAAGLLLITVGARSRNGAGLLPRAGAGELSVTLAAAPPGIDRRDPGGVEHETPATETVIEPAASMADDHDAPQLELALAPREISSTRRFTEPASARLEASPDELTTTPPPQIDKHEESSADHLALASVDNSAPPRRRAGAGGAIEQSAVAVPAQRAAGDGPGQFPRGVAGGTGTRGLNSARSSSGGNGGQDKSSPLFDDNPLPIYPVAARREGRQGTVTLRIWVAANGRVTRVEVAESSGYADLDESAVKTVSTWRGRAAEQFGVPTESVELLPVRFVLQ